MKPINRPGRAFSLIELLVVIAIVAIVIAILIPALRSARITARKTATGATLRDLCTASQAFLADTKRSPGYFSPAQMGAAANATANGGFVGMQNVLLDLAGGVTSQTGGTVISVGPGGAQTVNVDVTKIGAGGSGKGYFTPRKDALVADAGLVGNTQNKQMPMLMDAFGNPILAWVADERPSQQFAAVDSTQPAKFYWASNAGVLNSPGIGRDQRPQAYSVDTGSMLGGAGANDLAGNLTALLGSPAYPSATNNTVPGAPRGTIVFQSAGADGFFMGRNDRGTKVFGTPATPILSVPYRGGTNIDVLGDFDDVVQSTGQ
ncbi:MAG: prepilin-type N-terminal cleavage/methylation domain-containing protein [Phycisphaerales bacterium]|nr:prepilin-type N-terminal cleavage/methylation domain-containing protein [Phycisphaerales bacterium]